MQKSDFSKFFFFAGYLTLLKLAIPEEIAMSEFSEIDSVSTHIRLYVNSPCALFTILEDILVNYTYFDQQSGLVNRALFW